MENPTPHPRADVFVAIAMLALVVPFALALGDIYVDPFDPGFGARDFPTAILVGIVVLACILLFGAVREIRKGDAPPVHWEDLRTLGRFGIPLVALGFLYIWSFTLFQYLLPTALVTGVVLAMFGNRGWVRLGLVPVVTAVIFYAVFFGFLNLYEPEGSILNLSGGRVSTQFADLVTE